MTVPADKPDPFAWVNQEISIGKEHLFAIGFGEIDHFNQ